MNNILKIFFLIFLEFSCNFLNAQPHFGAALKKNADKVSIESDAKNFHVEICYKNEKALAAKKTYIASGDSTISVFNKTLNVFIKTKKNVFLNINKKNSTNIINIYLHSVGTLYITNAFNQNIAIYNENSNNKLDHRSINAIDIKINNSYISTANFQGLCTDALEIARSRISYLNLKTAGIKKKITISETRLDSSNFYHTYLPRIITLKQLYLNNLSGFIDFTQLRNLDDTLENTVNSNDLLERTIKIRMTNLNKLKIPYDKFSFHVDSTQAVVYRIDLYEKLLKNLSEVGFLRKYDYYNMQYREINDWTDHRPLTNMINKRFWNKGRNKGQAVICSVILFAVFYILNLILFRYIRKVYLPLRFKAFFSKQKKQYKKKQSVKKPYFFHTILNTILYFISYLFGVFLYTSYIFWGLKLNLTKLKIKHYLVLGLIVTQYVTGLICVAYLISFIVVKQ